MNEAKEKHSKYAGSFIRQEMRKEILKVEYIQDKGPVQKTDFVSCFWDKKNNEFESFDFETNLWKRERFFTQKHINGQSQIYCNFTGIIQYGDTLILALPKSVKYDPDESDEKKKHTLIKYAKLFDQYFEHVMKAAKDVNYVRRKPWYIGDQESTKKKSSVIGAAKSAAKWCEQIMDIPGKRDNVKVIAAVKFEKIYEWLLSWMFENQIKIQTDNCVIFSSQILGHDVNINDGSCNAYTWDAIGKRGEDWKINDRDYTFSDQNKRNIPDIVCEVLKGSPEEQMPQADTDGKTNTLALSNDTCVVIDAKYSGWQIDEESGNGRYKLPANLDIYKQFFYQEQMKILYENAKREDVAVYNLFVLPDYQGDTETHMFRLCGVSCFKNHPFQRIGVLQVDLQRLIDGRVEGQKKGEILSDPTRDVFAEKERILRLLIMKNDKYRGLGEPEEKYEKSKDAKKDTKVSES